MSKMKFNYCNFLCLRCFIIPDFSSKKLEVHIIHNFIIFRMQQTKIISTVQTNIFYVITEKYPLECVFVYNFVSLNVNLFLQ